LHRILILAVLVLAALPAHADQRFESLKNRAQRLDSLSGFLERFLGGCQDDYDKRSCEQNVRVARKDFEGKLLMVTIGEQTPNIVKVESNGNRFRIFLTPFIDGGGYALTNGAPAKQDQAGRPLIGYIVIDGSLPPGGEMDFTRSFRTGSVELEVVFKPEGTWKLKRKGESGYYEGVKARFMGVRLVNYRTGSEIAAKMLGDA
jgi:hypothetical protein